jgi:hypothetical protein
MAKQLPADDYYTNRLRELCADLAFMNGGVFFLSKTEVARRLDLGESAAEARVRYLVEHGELEVVRAADPKRHTPPRYRLRAPQGG